jgi:hypothetical protein
MSMRWSFAVLAGLFVSAAALADPPCSHCNESKAPPYIYKFCGSCKNKHYPPYVNPNTPFGYYPNSWREWPVGNVAPVVQNEPPMFDPNHRQQMPEAEPLPPPRPADAPLKPLLFLR